MPPPAETEVAVAQLVPLALLLLLLLLLVLPLLELEELQPTVSSRLPATAAAAAMACLARTIPSQSTVPRAGTEMSILARQVRLMASQGKREVASSWRPGIG
jgi:hypothetical protein